MKCRSRGYRLRTLNLFQRPCHWKFYKQATLDVSPEKSSKLNLQRRPGTGCETRPCAKTSRRERRSWEAVKLSRALPDYGGWCATTASLGACHVSWVKTTVLMNLSQNLGRLRHGKIKSVLLGAHATGKLNLNCSAKVLVKQPPVHRVSLHSCASESSISSQIAVAEPKRHEQAVAHSLL